MKMNKKKSGIIFHTKQGPKPKEYNQPFEGIPVVEKYKYRRKYRCNFGIITSLKVMLDQILLK